MIIASKKNRKIAKILAFISIIFIIVYVTFCFIAAKHIKDATKILSYEQGNWNISHQGIKVAGFPFKFKLQAKQVKVVYNNKIINMRIETLLDTLEIQTSPLFTHISFLLPKKIAIDTYYNQQFKQWEFATASDPFIEIEEDSLANSLKILELIYNPKKFDEQEYKLKGIRYNYQDLHFMDRTIDKEIFNSNTETAVKIKDRLAESLSVGIKSNSYINFIASDYVGHQFKKVTYQADVIIKTKKFDDKYSLMSLIDIKTLNFSIDDFNFALSGNINNDNNEMKFDLELKLKEWDTFINQLLVQNLISEDKNTILKNFIQETTGKEDNNNVEVKIYTAKEGGVRIGKIDANTLNGYFSQFMLSQ